MMKKIISVVLSVLVFFNLFSFILYGKQLNLLPSVFYTEKAVKKPLDSKDYSVFVENNKSDKKVTITEYVSSRGNFMSLREIVEALGGSIQWTPEVVEWRVRDYAQTYQKLGSFSLMGYNFEYYTPFGLHDGGTDLENYMLVDIYMDCGDSKIYIPMQVMDTSPYSKFINGRLYVAVDFLSAIMPRIGYVSTVNKKSGIISIDKYDFESEKEIMLKKFPKQYLEKERRSIYLIDGDGLFKSNVSKFFQVDVFECFDKFALQYNNTLNFDIRNSKMY